MTARQPHLITGLSHEIEVVIALTLLGAVVRFWSFGRLGLIHFDEGIYALAGLWSLSPTGLAGLDPMVISYAPPGFPVLVGLSYLVTFPVFGVRDFAAILVSVCAGILTIPVVAWLARRTFGPGAGGAAAAFAALSGAHIAFSRMALTDTSFLLCWLIAIGLGQRFLERPNAWRALLLGLGVGVAQLFKYSGWIAGAVVAASSLLRLACPPKNWRTRFMAATWGWGVFAAIVAAIVYGPWFAFVETHGGYGALLAHQRSYLKGLTSWPGHFSLQLEQMQLLSGSPGWTAWAGLLAGVGMSLSIQNDSFDRRVIMRILVGTFGLTALVLFCGSLWWPTSIFLLGSLVAGRGVAKESMAVIGVGFTILSVMTPFYHPYARLWLPVEAFCWLLMGGLFVTIRSCIEVGGRGARWTCDRGSDRLPWFTVICVTAAVLAMLISSSRQRMSPLEPSDSLRHASRLMLDVLPRDVKELNAYARPAVSYYLGLAGGITVRRQPDLRHLLEVGNSHSWAVLDLTLIRQQNIQKRDLDKLLANWLVIREIPTTLNAPTLLDIDPSAAHGAIVDASAPLKLLRRGRLEKVP